MYQHTAWHTVKLAKEMGGKIQKKAPQLALLCLVLHSISVYMAHMKDEIETGELSFSDGLCSMMLKGSPFFLLLFNWLLRQYLGIHLRPETNWVASCFSILSAKIIAACPTHGLGQYLDAHSSWPFPKAMLETAQSSLTHFCQELDVY